MRPAAAIIPVLIACLWAGACDDEGPSSAGTAAQRAAAGNEVVSAGFAHTVGLADAGTAVATGSNDSKQCDVSGWSDLVAVSAGDAHSVGLRADGTAVATGSDRYGQCDVSGWRDLVGISAGGNHTVGLRADGTAVATGNDDYGQCDVSGWRDLVAVSAGGAHTVGVRADGTAVAVGYNENGRCDVGPWRDLVAVSAGGYHTVGLRADGRALAVGTDDARCDVRSWRDLVAVSAGGGHTVGLRANGRAVATGAFEAGQVDIGSWRDLVAVSAGFEHTVGLRADGRVVAVGDPRLGQCDVSGWRLALPAGEVAGNGRSASASPSSATPVDPGDPSSIPVVYLVDGSGARECIVSNKSWAAQVEDLGGPKVSARDMGVRNQTFLQDGLLIDALPEGEALVLIGLSVGRFAGDPREGIEGYDPEAVLRSTAEVEHIYSVRDVLSDREKRARLHQWLTEKSKLFEQTHAANAEVLDDLVDYCRSQGLYPVLVELPINLDIVGSALDGQRAAYRRDARRVAARHDIPYIDFVDEVDLSSGDFFDLVHLVEPGRVKWQRRLSEEVVTLLRRYRIDDR